jgi:hypothetical protein
MVILQTTAAFVDASAETTQTVKSEVPVADKKVDEKELQKQKEREVCSLMTYFS